MWLGCTVDGASDATNSSSGKRGRFVHTLFLYYHGHVEGCVYCGTRLTLSIDRQEPVAIMLDDDRV
jgi:hypothetical protein